MTDNHAGASLCQDQFAKPRDPQDVGFTLMHQTGKASPSRQGKHIMDGHISLGVGLVGHLGQGSTLKGVVRPGYRPSTHITLVILSAM